MDFLSNLGIWGGGWTGWFLPFIFALSVVVFFHELGHFLVARWCGVRVLVFSIGFGPELIGFDDRHGTRWKISAIPLGGYVKFFGDDNAASVPDQEDDRPHDRGRAARQLLPQVGRRARRDRRCRADREFHPGDRDLRGACVLSRPAGHRSAHRRSHARQRGGGGRLQAGDVVVSADGKTVEGFSDVQRIAAFNAGHPLAFVIDRGGDRVTVTATPEERAERDRFGNCSASAFSIFPARSCRRASPGSCRVRRRPPASSRKTGCARSTASR